MELSFTRNHIASTTLPFLSLEIFADEGLSKDTVQAMTGLIQKAWPFFLMIADQEQERLGVGELAGADNRVPVAQSRGLLNEAQAASRPRRSGRVGCLVTRANHDANLLDSGSQNFLDENTQSRFGLSVAIDESLQRQCPLRFPRRGDDSFFDVHKLALSRRDVYVPTAGTSYRMPRRRQSGP